MAKKLKSNHNKFKKENKDILYKGFNKKGKRKEDKLTCLEELSSHLNLPADLIAGVAIITITGRNEIRVENSKGIIEFDNNKIKIKSKSYQICIEGKQLKILYFTEDEIRITGYIRAIYYQ